MFAAAASGLSGAAAIIATVSISGSEARSELKFIYVTYTRIHPITLQVYSGRTSGYGTAEELVAARGKQQVHLNNEGFESPSVDESSESKSEIRGREQQLIDFYGGAQSVGGTSRNMINGDADFNFQRPVYMNLAAAKFGALPDNSPARKRWGQ